MRKNPSSCETGSFLIELMVATALISFAVLFIASAITYGNSLAADSRKMLTAVQIAENVAEDLLLESVDGEQVQAHGGSLDRTQSFDINGRPTEDAPIFKADWTTRPQAGIPHIYKVDLHVSWPVGNTRRAIHYVIYRGQR